MKKSLSIAIFLSTCMLSLATNAQEQGLKLWGAFSTDQRWFAKDHFPWAWSENRLSLQLSKRNADDTKFKSEIWLRNFGLPVLFEPSQLYSKSMTDPYDIEIREAWVSKPNFLTKNLDLTIGRQRIAWGTADKINPTDNLNPLDLEDILDFGRRRGIDALNLQYASSDKLSIQAVLLPWFRPANLPSGPFSGLLMLSQPIPNTLTINSIETNLIMPEAKFASQAAWGFRAKTRINEVDMSVSYSNTFDGLPYLDTTRFLPDGSMGVKVISQTKFTRLHAIGADIATSIGGAGLWAEAALFAVTKNHQTTTDMSALVPYFPGLNAYTDSLLLDTKKPWIKWVVGSDYHFRNNTYINLQIAHGFYHERGQNELNNYISLRIERNLLSDKILLAPLNGAFVFRESRKLNEDYAMAWMPEISYKPISDLSIAIKAVIFEGKGQNLFARLDQYDMFVFKAVYNF